jgi:hypothetical protein
MVPGRWKPPVPKGFPRYRRIPFRRIPFAGRDTEVFKRAEVPLDNPRSSSARRLSEGGFESVAQYTS